MLRLHEYSTLFQHENKSLWQAASGHISGMVASVKALIEASQGVFSILK